MRSSLNTHQYTRPEEFEGLEVPKILLSGHHQNIRDYRPEEQVRLITQKAGHIAKGLQEGIYPEKVIELIRKLLKETSHERKHYYDIESEFLNRYS